MTVKRFVITNMNAKGDLRVLTWPAQGRYTYATREEAEEVLLIFHEGLRKVIGDRVSTLEVTEVDCHDGHFDPTRTVW